MLLRQRGMRLTIISILDDLAVKLPPLRPSIQQVRQQFASRFKHEDTMMQQITPPGFNAAEKVGIRTVQVTLQYEKGRGVAGGGVWDWEGGGGLQYS